MTIVNPLSETLTKMVVETEASLQLRNARLADTSQLQLQKLRAKGNRGLMRRLRHSEGGNVMAIAAASLLPLMALIGGAVDVSRIYLTKTRLQQACDAGSLAGRKSMAGLNFTTANKGMAEEFFRSNFPEGKYGTGSVAVDFTASAAGAVTGTAKVSVPMTLMAMFGQEEREISATCTADLQLPNTDVMFVLDTTRSMVDVNSGDSESRIAVLRKSVAAFYDTLEQVRPERSNIRYGFVPYSSTVNVGTLLRPEWIVDNATYDSRMKPPAPDDVSEIPGTPTTAPPTITLYSNAITTGSVSSNPQFERGQSENCKTTRPNTYSSTTTYTAWDPSDTFVPRSRTQTTVQTGIIYSASVNAAGECWIKAYEYHDYTTSQTVTIDENPDAGKVTTGSPSTVYHWIYKPISYSMSALKGLGSNGGVKGGSFTAPVGYNHSDTQITWNETNACIEERATSVPSYDTDIELVPTADPATQWTPYLPGLVYARKAYYPTDTISWLYTNDPETKTKITNPTYTTDYYTPSNYPNYEGACPSPARKLAPIDAGQLTTYLNGLRTVGYTYHDVGFAWGLRLMSPIGLFKSEHEAAEQSGRISRHLIFMTDGKTDTRYSAYDAWGLSAMDRRRTPTNAIPTNAAQNAITEDRLQDLCTYAKEHMNITVWVIAFGDEFKSNGVVAVPPNLKSCASDGRAYAAADAATLNEAFAKIATQIAQLRITK